MLIRLIILPPRFWHMYRYLIAFSAAILSISNPSTGWASLRAESPPWQSHLLTSPFQAQETSLRVLLPKLLKPATLYPCLFVLPVHQDGDFRHGDGLAEVLRLDIHNRYQVICVAPSFTAEPWYVDHDENPSRRDESHLLETVIPFIESRYSVRTDREGRFLVGFSKSGRGALSLLLRHPDVFYKAVAWDPGIRIDMGPHGDPEETARKVRDRFGSQANYRQHQIPHLIRRFGRSLGEEARLFYFNCEGVSRTAGGSTIHSLLVQEGVLHRYVLEANREHRWGSGWLPEALLFLFPG